MTKVDELTTAAELAAKKAENLPAFSGLSLIHIKRQVARILELIGREGIFDQYTVHDISHIDKMLGTLDWLIPDSTKKIMSPADWLMTVLSIYFHDMGMLVTAEEFDSRSTSDFPRYRDEVLFGGAEGADYQAKVKTLPEDRVERFLYQEFVRHKHAERIRNWVMGRSKEDLGISHAIVDEINKLLATMKPNFRRDLGLICESHHLNDLSDLKKYKPSQPYGDSDEETANLQYCAVLLRTADLLHVTSDRTPSVSFRLINPTDPISQEEWAKQMAVTRVRPKLGLDEDGKPSESAPKDTIEVHAYFKSEDGFFGLTSYLTYTSTQLKRSFEWIDATKKEKLARHEFPWRKIDDSQIETEGFIRDAFEFAIDQAKILDLLTGHTLYNDTRVVLRELAQNSIDAIRIQNYPNPPRPHGKVTISWDSKKRVLAVTDNGTGMTQQFISNFLLKVGTSRYQDPEFKKQYPAFSSISRFGIGVLSTFMIADSVEIVTCHTEDAQARQLTLRSVHGKYLIRVLDKSDNKIKPIAPHGTRFTLKVRASVNMPDVIETAKQWLVVPDCDIFVQIDTQSPIKIGHESPANALVELINDRGLSAELGKDTKAPPEGKEHRQIRVIERTIDGVTVAYAIEWSEYFREWSFVNFQRLRRVEGEANYLGTCIEGIRVELATPGFEGANILAIANVVGVDAPKTNVARSGIEATSERDHMLRKIYAIYCGHVAQELQELYTSRGFSLTWGISEARYLVGPLMEAERERTGRPISKLLFEDALQELPLLAVESKDSRQAISVKKLVDENEFWTVDCALFHSAEPLIREAGTAASLSGIVKALEIPNFKLPNALVLCGVSPNDRFGVFSYKNREVGQIEVYRSQRRVDLRWVNESTPPRWVSLISNPRLFSLRSRIYNTLSHRVSSGSAPIFVGIDNIKCDAELSEIAIKAFSRLFVLPNTNLAQYMKPLFEKAAASGQYEAMLAAIAVEYVVGECFRSGNINISDGETAVRRLLRRLEGDIFTISRIEPEIKLPELADLVESTAWRLFDPSAWARGKSFLDEW